MEHQTWVLRDILSHLEYLETLDDKAPNGIAGEFARLRNQSTKYRNDKTLPTKTADKQENAKKNRYKDIVPFDHSRVKLSLTTSKKDTDYINASFIKGASGTRAYIATQGPLPHTVVDFLRMTWEYDVKVIVMACREFEMGKKKCELYWPRTLGETLICEPFSVFCDSEESKGDYVTRTLRVTYRDRSHTLKQLHYVNWPDHGVPDSIPPILDMLYEMRSYQAHDDVPICIHCSAGCGRTGVLCVIDYTWNLLKQQTISSDFNIYNLVQDMRKQRPSVVQTKEQYLLVYRTIRVLLQRYLDFMEPQACQNEWSAVQPGLPEPEPELSDHSDEFEFMSEQPQLLDVDQQRDPTPQFPPQTVPETLTANTPDQREELRFSPDLNCTSQSAPAERESSAEADDASMRSSPLLAVAEAVRLMVEDPYFDSGPSGEEEGSVEASGVSLGMESSTCEAPLLLLNGQTSIPDDFTSSLTDEENPPPLPERTPESFVLAAEEEIWDPCARLSVVLPLCHAAETATELGGNPPSPVPPLPERTPESFELAVDSEPCEQQRAAPSAPPLDSEGNCGWSKPPVSVFEDESTSCPRKKSLRAEADTTALPLHHDLPASPKHDHFLSLDPPASLLLAANHDRISACPEQTWLPSPRIGLSSEWAGSSQPKNFLNSFMRSKSVRAKGSKQEPSTVFTPLTPLPVVDGRGGSVAAAAECDVNLGLSEKSMTRTKSLKCFKNKLRPKVAPPPPPVAPPPSSSSSSSSALFKFGFGNRFKKPKGPRTYPETWV